jgi:hypothetical protein
MLLAGEDRNMEAANRIMIACLDVTRRGHIVLPLPWN